MSSNGDKVNTKRKSRSNVVVDEDDILLLNILSVDKSLHLSKVEKEMSISRTGILNHLTRLESFGWVTKQKSNIPGDHRSNVVLLTEEGLSIHKLLIKAYSQRELHIHRDFLDGIRKLNSSQQNNNSIFKTKAEKEAWKTLKALPKKYGKD